MPCVEFRNTSKRFDGAPGLTDASVSLRSGKTTAVIGESGSGKSTLLNLVSGLLKPDEGEVRVFDEPLDYRNLVSLRRRMGFAVQGAALFPHLTVFDNVTLVSRLDGWKKPEISRRFAELMDMHGLASNLQDRYPHELSGGQQQRVGLCRALMLNPPLLLLDEPFSALDPVTRHALQEEFLKIQQAQPRSVLLVTHDMSEAGLLADDVIVLRLGRLVQQGRVSAVMQSPADDYVAELLAPHEESQR